MSFKDSILKLKNSMNHCRRDPASICDTLAKGFADLYDNAEGGSASQDYSTTEHVIGKWIDGKPLYQKTVEFGTLPAGDSKAVAHGVANINLIVSCDGFAYNSSYTFIPLPSINVDSLDYGAQLECDRTNITIKTKETWMNGYSGYVTIQYTKTSD